MTDKVSYSIRIESELYSKIKYIAKRDVRSVNNLFEYLLRKCVAEYEEKHGSIILYDEITE